MTKSKEKNLKLIKRKRIWPSILLFVLSLSVAVIVITVFFSMFILYVFNNKSDTERKNARIVTESIIDAYNKTGDIQYACESAYENSYGVYDFAVIDAYGNYIAGYGEQTYNLENCSEYHLPGSEENVFYLDEKTKDSWILKDDMSFAFPIGKIFKEINSSDSNGGEEEVQGTEVTIWLVRDIDNTEYSILTKITFRITKNDVFFVAVFLVLTVIAITVPSVIQFISLLCNIVRQRKMAKLIYYDPVTGGNNWLYFKHKAFKLLTQSDSVRNDFLIADLQVNKFRNYCSCHGVKKGQNMLREIDDMMSAVLAKKDLCTHYANADFGILLRCASLDEGISKVNDIINRLSDMPDGHKITFHAGICYIPASDYESRAQRRNTIDVDQLFNNAGIARGSSSNNDENGVTVFDQSMLEQRLWEHKVENTMEQALINEEFAVYIQPKYNPSTNELKGAEALVRWISPTDGFISPGKFIPIFENNGFITKLDDYMISHVAKLQSDWLAAGKKVVPISVNVSRAHFTEPKLAEHICSLVDKYSTPHNLIEIELTESAFFDDKDVLLTTVKKLKELGFEISMDDFGSGYSSLNSLKDLPLDVLKLDAEFFRGDLSDKRGEIVVSEAITLAKNLDMKIVAEGIEKKEQVDFLASLECDMIQGYYFAKPMPVNEFEEKAFQ